MQHVRLGRTGLRVSNLCLGTMTFGYQCDEATSFSIMDAAAEAGITFFDTADIYPLGAPWPSYGITEEIIGRWLNKGDASRREDFVIATKCFAPTGPQPWHAGNSRHNIIRALDASLRRLQTDYVDLYQLHFWDANTPIDETLGALDDVVRAGKVRYVGCSNFLAYQLARSVGRSEALGVVRFDSVQPRYNLLYRPIERELLPLCVEEGIGVIPYNPLAGGFLTGKHERGAPTEGTRFTLGNASERYQERYWHDRMFDTVDELKRIADEAGMSMAQLAVAWTLATPGITSPIVGASKPSQLADSVAAAAAPMDAALKQRLDDLTYEYRAVETAR